KQQCNEQRCEVHLPLHLDAALGEEGCTALNDAKRVFLELEFAPETIINLTRHRGELPPTCRSTRSSVPRPGGDSRRSPRTASCSRSSIAWSRASWPSWRCTSRRRETACRPAGRPPRRSPHAAAAAGRAASRRPRG